MHRVIALGVDQRIFVVNHRVGEELNDVVVSKTAHGATAADAHGGQEAGRHVRNAEGLSVAGQTIFRGAVVNKNVIHAETRFVDQRGAHGVRPIHYAAVRGRIPEGIVAQRHRVGAGLREPAL